MRIRLKADVRKIVKKCWQKKNNEWKDGHGKKREKCYNRNGQDIEAIKVRDWKRKFTDKINK